MSINFQAINDKEKYFDIKYYNDIEYEKRKDSKDNFGIEIMQKVPSESEVRLLGNRHRECFYYSAGLEFCKKKVVSSMRTDYLACKNVIDAMYRCYTNDSAEQEYHKIDEVGKPYMKEFFNCLFTKNNSVENCFGHFENSIRAVYRAGKYKLIDY